MTRPPRFCIFPSITDGTHQHAVRSLAGHARALDPRDASQRIHTWLLGIVEHLRLASDDVLRVGESALYPALQRLLVSGWVRAEWGTSENNRRARCYTLTPAGRRQLVAERAESDRLVGAIQQVLGTTA